MTGLTLRDVKKSFGKVDVIHGVDLSIQSGEFVVFVGPSGCGKSTLLRLIAGLEETTSGTLEIGEQDVTHVEAADRGIAMVFQSYALYPHMSVAENMGFGLKMTGSPKAEVEQRVAAAAEILQLGTLLDRKPKALSGGQRQRVAIGRAIVRQPKVFLFDEPLSNLDAELRVQMRLEIAKLHKDLKSTMVYVTHDQVEAMTLADKIVVLRAGRVEQFGSPLELYDNPDNIFVGGFIGSPRMNFLQGKVTASEANSATIEIDGFDGASLTKTLHSPPAAGSNVTVGIRPEHFIENGVTRLEVKIDVIENLGGVAYGYARAETDTPLTIQLNEGHSAEEDGMLVTGFNADRAFLFDTASEQRIR